MEGEHQIPDILPKVWTNQDIEVQELRSKIRSALFDLQEVINSLCKLRDDLYHTGIRNEEATKKH